MIIRFPKQLLKQEVYDSIKTKYIENFVSYIINSDYRKAVELKYWIKEQVDNPTIAVQNFCDSIITSEDYDIQMVDILRKVRAKIEYISDDKKWSIPEKWNTADETLTADITVRGIRYKPMQGDCEDGAILMYVLARLKGIPENRLLIIAGDVKGGGHCWLGYKPLGIPKDFAFMDWCYWVDVSDMDVRNKFTILGYTITEYPYGNDYKPLTKSNYITTWFTFNESHAYRAMNYSNDL